MKSLFLSFIFIAFSYFCLADNYETANNGNWKSGSTWQGGAAAPTTGDFDNFFIYSGDTVILNDSLSLKNNCELRVNGKLTINGDLVANNNLSIVVTGTLIINGDLKGKNGETITISGNVIVAGDVTSGNNGNIVLDDGSLDVGGSLICNANCEITGTGTINIDGNNDYDDTLPSGITVNEHLPVELLFFEANCNTLGIAVSWATATESNSAAFILLRSHDAIQYDPVASLQAAGNSNHLKEYSITDADHGDKVYYQLEQLDLDGKQFYFGPIVISCKEQSDFSLRLDNSNDELIVEAYRPYTGMHLKIFDMTGNLLREKNFGKDGIQKEPLQSLPQGVYFVSIQIDDQSAQVVKIVKL